MSLSIAVHIPSVSCAVVLTPYAIHSSRRKRATRYLHTFKRSSATGFLKLSLLLTLICGDKVITKVEQEGTALAIAVTPTAQNKATKKSFGFQVRIRTGASNARPALPSSSSSCLFASDRSISNFRLLYNRPCLARPRRRRKYSPTLRIWCNLRSTVTMFASSPMARPAAARRILCKASHILATPEQTSVSVIRALEIYA